MQVGKSYLVNSNRKGTFSGRLKSLCDTWATFVITGGRARAMLPENEREQQQGAFRFLAVAGSNQRTRSSGNPIVPSELAARHDRYANVAADDR